MPLQKVYLLTAAVFPQKLSRLQKRESFWHYSNIPCSAVIGAEAVSEAGGELIAVAAQKLVDADKFKALLGQRVYGAQHGRNGGVLRVVQQDYIAVASVLQKPVVDVFLIDMHPVTR